MKNIIKRQLSQYLIINVASRSSSATLDVGCSSDTWGECKNHKVSRADFHWDLILKEDNHILTTVNGIYVTLCGRLLWLQYVHLFAVIFSLWLLRSSSLLSHFPVHYVLTFCLIHPREQWTYGRMLVRKFFCLTWTKNLGDVCVSVEK